MMSGIVASAVLLGIVLLLRDVITALFVQELKGALAERLERNVARAAQLIPDDQLAAEMHAEWRGELGAAKDRPLKAVQMVRGYREAARSLAAEAKPVPVNEADPAFAQRVTRSFAKRISRPSARQPTPTIGGLEARLEASFQAALERAGIGETTFIRGYVFVILLATVVIGVIDNGGRVTLGALGADMFVVFGATIRVMRKRH